MTDQAERARSFHALHVKGSPVILFNIWDPGSAKVVAGAGARAIATGSAPVAMAHGFADGEKIPLDMAMDNLRRIVAAVDLPVTADIEGGYGIEPTVVAKTVAAAIEAGAVGINFEDQVVGGSGLHDVSVQVERISAAAEAVQQSGVQAYINARTDIFLKAKPDEHDEALIDQAVERAKAYASAGAHGFFAPGLRSEGLIARLVERVELPVNIIALDGVPPTRRLADLGVARVSYGPVPWRRMAAWLEKEAREALEA